MSVDEEHPGTSVRRLLRQERRAALATLEPTGAPYVSLVMLAVDHDASPLLLLSDLAQHTQNLKRDPRVSLLVDGTAGQATPLAGARATLMGSAKPAEQPHQRARYTSRHPDAAHYATFADFNLYRLALERAHLVAGFGRIAWAPAADVLLDLPADLPLAAAEAEILAHMNADHADAVALYAERLLGQAPGAWRLTGVDPEGADLAAEGRKTARLDFAKPVLDAEAARGAFVRLVKRARQGPDDKA